MRDLHKPPILHGVSLSENNLQVYAMMMSVEKLIESHMNKDNASTDKELDMWTAIFADYYIRGEEERYKEIVRLFMYAIGMQVLYRNYSYQDWIAAYEKKE